MLCKVLTIPFACDRQMMKDPETIPLLLSLCKLDYSSQMTAVKVLAELAEERERSKLLDTTKFRVVELESSVKSLQSKLDDASTTNRALNEDATAKLKLLKESFAAKVSSLDSEVRKEKKRADAYKSKAVEAHNRAKYSA